MKTVSRITEHYEHASVIFERVQTQRRMTSIADKYSKDAQ